MRARHGGRMPEDMVAQRLSAEIRWVVAGAPSCLERHGVPSHPNDLLNHRCLRTRLAASIRSVKAGFLMTGA